MASLALLVLSLVTSVVGDETLELPDLARDALPAWREHLRPTADELAYEAIDWIPHFAEGVLAAQEADRPLLFWAMNGHPLACT